MTETQRLYNNMSKKKYELDDKIGELMKAKDEYKDHLVNETIAAILHVQNEEGKLDERTLKLFLRNLSTDIEHIYSR